MTDEHKQKISEACKGKTKNQDSVWVTNGYHRTRVRRDTVENYLKQGYWLGKKLFTDKFIAWNKGLTKETDDRVSKYIDSRKNKK